MEVSLLLIIAFAALIAAAPFLDQLDRWVKDTAYGRLIKRLCD